MEKAFLIGGLIAVFFYISIVESCQSNCCQSSCCQSSSCCSQCASQCQTSTCCASCQQQCDTDKCKTTTAKPERVGTSTEHKSSISTVTNNNNTNSNNMTTTINITNIINNDNHINIPININNTNIQSVQIIPGNVDAPRPPPSSDHTTTRRTTTDHRTTPCPTVGPPVTINVPVKVPVPVPYPIPYPVTTPPQPRPQPHCCVMITPCLIPRCNPYRRICGGQCTSSVIYRPVDPCSGGCYRRDYFERTSCHGFGNCQNSHVNCDQCGHDFYRTYEGYRDCGGCFTQGW